MNADNRVKLIGLRTLKETIAADCCTITNHNKFKKPQSFIVKLDSGNGRSRVIEYAVSEYRETGVLDFSSSRSECLDLCFDGSYYRFKLGQEIVERAAEYKNCYEGVIGISGVPLRNMNEETKAELKEWLTEITAHAAVFFFVSTDTDEEEEAYVEIIKTIPCEIVLIEPETYTKKDYSEAVVNEMYERGFEITNKSYAVDVFTEIFRKVNISTMKEACTFSNMLFRFINIENNEFSIDRKQLAGSFGIILKDIEKGVK